MKIIDNINNLFGDDLKQAISSGTKLKIAASCFSIYAYEALKKELAKVESLEFIFTSPTFIPNEAIDNLKKERREFFIPKAERERSFYGSEFILAQISEAIEGNTKDNKDYLKYLDQEGIKPVVTEISKERIRRAGQKIKEDNADKVGIENLDIGFRVLKVDSTNMNDVYYLPDKVKQDSLKSMEKNIKDDRTAEDLLFHVLLDWGLDLSAKIVKEEIQGKAVYFVNDDDLAVCFDDGVDEELVKALAKRKVMRVVFKDTGFAKDEIKDNVEQIFKQLSPETEVRAI